MVLEKKLVEAALSAGAHIRERAFIYKQLDWKGKDDPVTELDKEGERIIRKLAGEVNFLGEEFGEQNNGSEYTWIIDPIDGTKSFIRGEHLSATSIGVEKNGHLIAGVVYDFMRDLLYVAVDGKCYLQHNLKKFPMGKAQMSSKAYISTSNLTESEIMKLSLPNWSLRDRSGSIALNLAHLANGNIEAIVGRPEKGKGYPWDVAGGIALLKVNGYEVLTDKFEPYHHRESSGIIAAKPEIMKKIADALGGKYGKT
jgi:myo-inositol-1(or 4)-monophosphatase